MTNRMYINVNLNVNNSKWSPGSPLINDPKYGLNTLSNNDKMKIQNDFSRFLAKTMRDLLKKRITTQYRASSWVPLSKGYVAMKDRLGLSPNIWEATGYLLDSISYYRKGNEYIVGIHPNKKYPNSRTKVLFVAKCMEFGTEYMPARPLFGPVVTFMRRNIRRYWELYLDKSGGKYNALRVR